jgi:hypothetical protein
MILIFSGNLSFLNWLTMVPAIMCFDDALICHLFSPSMQARAAAASVTSQMSVSRKVISYGFLALILQLSIPVVKNMLSKKQIMNCSFDPLRLVNSYGAFGTVSENRDEYIISSATSWDGPWKEYEFKVKPGDVNRRPRWISPYHYRLDWQMWIAVQCRVRGSSTWLAPFLIKLLQQDDSVLNDLMIGDPWKDSPDPPRYIRVDMYRYTFHKAIKGEKSPPYWDRVHIQQVFPRQGLATVDSLQT